MRKDRQEPFDIDQPTLIVTYGNTTRKYRSLDREVIVLGRAPTSDVVLSAADVALIHCLLIRRPNGGWRVRHFGGRIGTLLNGKPIQEDVVDHDDTLQVGPFSFRFHLPPRFRRPGLKTDVAPDAAEAAHLRRSRRNLARLALNLRERLHETTAELRRVEEQYQQLEQDVNTLRESGRARAKGITAEQELIRHRQVIEQQEAAQAERQRLTASEETRCQALRAAELEHYARHLRRVAERAAKHETELSRRAEERPAPRRRGAETQPMTTAALRERLEKVQSIKKGLAMLRTSDSAPGVPMKSAERAAPVKGTEYSVLSPE